MKKSTISRRSTENNNKDHLKRRYGNRWTTQKEDQADGR